MPKPPRKTFTKGQVTGIVVSDEAYMLSAGRMGAFESALCLYVETAIAWVDDLAQRSYGDVSEKFQRYFLVDDASQFSQVLKVLQRTAVGMRRRQEVKVQKLAPGRSGQVSGGFWTGNRRIHLNIYKVATFSSSPHLGAMLYLHEATHLYANTNDYGDEGYLEYHESKFEAQTMPYRAAGLTSAKALQNADSYAGFAYEATKA